MFLRFFYRFFTAAIYPQTLIITIYIYIYNK